MSEDQYTLNDEELIQAVLDDDTMWMVGALVPVPEDHEPGRRRIYHGSALAFFAACVQIFSGHRNAARQLRSLTLWNLYVQAFRDRFPNNPEMWPDPRKPIRRHHYSTFKSRYVAGNRWLVDQARVMVRRGAVRATETLGLCTEAAAGSLTHPSKECVISADGKVITPRFKPRRVDKETGELIGGGRTDPDANYFMTGTGERVWGNKFVIASTRGDEVNQRIILDVAEAPLAGGEAAHALDLFDELLPLMPWAQVIVYDGALRGVHLNYLMTKHGVIALARLHNKRGEQPLDRHYGDATIHRPDGTKDTADLHLHEGSVCLRELDEEGNIHLTRLERVKLIKTARSDGTWRWHMELAVPEEQGGGLIRLRCDQTKQDTKTNFNRAEHLRLIPDEDPDYPELMGVRQDSESGNRIIDDALPRERAHSVGSPSQLWDLIHHTAVRNARALAINRLRHPPPMVIAA